MSSAFGGPISGIFLLQLGQLFQENKKKRKIFIQLTIFEMKFKAYLSAGIVEMEEKNTEYEKFLANLSCFFSASLERFQFNSDIDGFYPSCRHSGVVFWTDSSRRGTPSPVSGCRGCVFRRRCASWRQRRSPDVRTKIASLDNILQSICKHFSPLFSHSFFAVVFC